MKGNSAAPGGPFKSKPTWSNTRGCSTTSVFFGLQRTEPLLPGGTRPMEKSTLPMAQQIAQAAIAFEKRRTGHVPKSVTVVLSEGTLVITLHDALSPAEQAMAKNP